MGLQISGCGTKQFSRTIKKGDFKCPRCQRSEAGTLQHFKHESYKKWITLFWIPVVPLSGFELVTCKKCHGEFPPNVLDVAVDTKVV